MVRGAGSHAGEPAAERAFGGSGENKKAGPMAGSPPKWPPHVAPKRRVDVLGRLEELMFYLSQTNWTSKESWLFH